MKDIVYPDLLGSKASIFASLNRRDLILIGSVFLIMSQFKVGGIKTLIVMILTIFVFKFISSKLQKNFFFRLIPQRLNWYENLRSINER